MESDVISRYTLSELLGVVCGDPTPRYTLKSGQRTLKEPPPPYQMWWMLIQHVEAEQTLCGEETVHSQGVMEGRRGPTEKARLP